MIKFKDFIQKIKTLYSRAIALIKAGLSRLGFGQSVSIKLSDGKLTEMADAGQQSKLGYYSEYITASELLRLLNDNNLKCEFQGSSKKAAVNKCAKHANDYLKILNDITSQLDGSSKDKFISEIGRQEINGKKMAESIYNDAIVVSDDLAFLNFEVVLTGDALKGENKADVVLNITKDSKKDVVDSIMASLKSYKSWNVNLSNTTIMSFFANLGIPLKGNIANKMKLHQNIRAEIWKYYKANDFKSVSANYGPKVAKVVKPMFDGQGRKTATQKDKDTLQQAYLTYSDIFLKDFIRTFDGLYKKNKKSVNEKMLELLGFDNSDDFYLAVGNAKNVKVLSNRTSDSYKELVEQLNKNYNLKITYNPKNTSTMTVEFNDPKGNNLIKGTLAFGKTGSTGSTKINYFVDFSKFKKDAK